MKKVLLSGGVILAFLLYGLHQRQEERQSLSLLTTDISSVTEEVSPTPSATADVATTSSSTPTPTPTPRGTFRNGTYTGSVEDAFYGNIQVKATVQNGKLAGVEFLQYPNDRPNSVQINEVAMPILQREAIAAQSASVNIVSGASDSSIAFRRSLANALNKAK
jgi:uncharacterized protein with FMN-binding domain